MIPCRPLCCTILCCLMTVIAAAEPPAAPPRPVSPAQAPPVQAPPAPDAPTPAAQAPAPFIVSLIDAGQEPRRPLRLAPAAGAEQRIRLSMLKSSRQIVGGFSAPDTNEPEIAYTIKVSVDKSADGPVTYLMAFEDATVEESQGVHPRMLEGMKQAAAGMVGMVARVRATDRGVVSSIEFDRRRGGAVRAQQLDAVAESLRRTVVPLPEEPIGVGGSWQVYSVIEQEGFTAHSTIVYKLTRLDEEGFEAELAVTMDADEHDAANTPPGTTQRLVSIDADGRGSVKQLFHHLLPQTMNMTTRTTIVSELETSRMTMSMTQNVRKVLMVREAKETKAPAEAGEDQR